MKRLTVIASLLLVPTFIVGLYGQNFRHIPELALGLRLLVVLGLDHRDDDRTARVLPLEALALTLSLERANPLVKRGVPAD